MPIRLPLSLHRRKKDNPEQGLEPVSSTQSLQSITSELDGQELIEFLTRIVKVIDSMAIGSNEDGQMVNEGPQGTDVQQLADRGEIKQEELRDQDLKEIREVADKIARYLQDSSIKVDKPLRILRVVREVHEALNRLWELTTSRMPKKDHRSHQWDIYEAFIHFRAWYTGYQLFALQRVPRNVHMSVIGEDPEALSVISEDPGAPSTKAYTLSEHSASELQGTGERESLATSVHPGFAHQVRQEQESLADMVQELSRQADPASSTASSSLIVPTSKYSSKKKRYEFKPHEALGLESVSKVDSSLKTKNYSMRESRYPDDSGTDLE